MRSPTRSSLAESPWLWAALFGGMGILGIVVIGPKYAVRTARIERMQDTRVRAAAEKVRAATAGGSAVIVEKAVGANEERPLSEPYKAADQVPPTKLLWLLGTMVLLLLVGVAGLLITRRGIRAVPGGAQNSERAGGGA